MAQCDGYETIHARARCQTKQHLLVSSCAEDWTEPTFVPQKCFSETIAYVITGNRKEIIIIKTLVFLKTYLCCCVLLLFLTRQLSKKCAPWCHFSRKRWNSVSHFLLPVAWSTLSNQMWDWRSHIWLETGRILEQEASCLSDYSLRILRITLHQAIHPHKTGYEVIKASWGTTVTARHCRKYKQMMQFLSTALANIQ